MNKPERLIHYFTPVLRETMSAVAALKRQESSFRLSAAAFADRVKADLESAQTRAIEEGNRQREEVENAAYAVVALIDDVLPQFRSWWSGEPIQLRMFQTRAAGDRFFDRANALTESQQELREVYLTVIALGFRGRLHEDRPEAADREEMRRRRLNTMGLLASRLSPQPVRRARFEGHEGEPEAITPQPYTAEPGPPLAAPRSLPWKWIAAAVAILLLLLAGGLTWLWLTMSSGPEPDPEPEPRALAERVDEHFAGLSCALIDYQLEGDVVRFSGVLSDAEAKRSLIANLQSEEGVSEVVDEDTQLLPPPFCTVLAGLDDAGIDFWTGPRPDVQLDRRDRRYGIDEAFVTTVDIPSGAGDELTVFYVHPDYIVPMLPAQVETELDGTVEPGDTIQLGRPEADITPEKHGWFTTGPVGPGMVVALSTEDKIFRNPPGQYGDVDRFLRAVERNLGSEEGEDPTGAFVVLEVTQ